MSETRFCVNCRHYLLLAPDDDPLCTRTTKTGDITSTMAQWLVTGRGKAPENLDFYRCSTERAIAGDTSCGPEGKFFAERKP